MRWISTLLYAFILKSEAGFNRPGSLSLYSKTTNPRPNKLLRRIRCCVITSGRKSNNLMKTLYRISKKEKKQGIFPNTKSNICLFRDDTKKSYALCQNISDTENINVSFIYSWQDSRLSGSFVNLRKWFNVRVFCLHRKYAVALRL